MRNVTPRTGNLVRVKCLRPCGIQNPQRGIEKSNKKVQFAFPGVDMDDFTRQSMQRTLYYFHMTHTNREVGTEPSSRGWLGSQDVQIIREWREIENKLNSLPATPDKMYNDSYKKVHNNGSIEIFPPEMVPLAICDICQRRWKSVPSGRSNSVPVDAKRRGRLGPLLSFYPDLLQFESF